MNAKQMETLAWHKDRANHGRGRLSADMRALIAYGYLKLVWTGHKDWVVTITPNGLRKLEEGK